MNVNVHKSYVPFMSVATVSLSGSEAHEVNILRATGAQQSYCFHPHFLYQYCNFQLMEVWLFKETIST